MTAVATYTFCYVGMRSCCRRPFFVSIDDGEVSEGVREAVSRGDIVEYMRFEDAMGLPFGIRCQHEAAALRKGERGGEGA